VLTCAVVAGLGWMIPAQAAKRDASAAPPARQAKPKAPKVGEPAPLFKLPRLSDRGEVDLVDFVGARPIVLYFGSYT